MALPCRPQKGKIIKTLPVCQKIAEELGVRAYQVKEALSSLSTEELVALMNEVKDE
jgi:predicted ArsR family transcriptional regulator